MSTSNFGILISYIVPGATVLWGANYVSPVVSNWLGGSSLLAPTVGGFLYATLAAVAAGVTVSTVRWMIIDTVHRWTGLRRPDFDYAVLAERTAGFDLLVRHHYEYYKFHGNMLIALVFLAIARRYSLGFWDTPLDAVDLGLVLLAVVFFMGSRNTLHSYYVRVRQLLGENQLPKAGAPDRKTSGGNGNQLVPIAEKQGGQVRLPIATRAATEPAGCPATPSIALTMSGRDGVTSNQVADVTNEPAEAAHSEVASWPPSAILAAEKERVKQEPGPQISAEELDSGRCAEEANQSFDVQQ